MWCNILCLTRAPEVLFEKYGSRLAINGPLRDQWPYSIRRLRTEPYHYHENKRPLIGSHRADSQSEGRIFSTGVWLEAMRRIRYLEIRARGLNLRHGSEYGR